MKTKRRCEEVSSSSASNQSIANYKRRRTRTNKLEPKDGSFHIFSTFYVADDDNLAEVKLLIEEAETIIAKNYDMFLTLVNQDSIREDESTTFWKNFADSFSTKCNVEGPSNMYLAHACKKHHKQVKAMQSTSLKRKQSFDGVPIPPSHVVSGSSSFSRRKVHVTKEDVNENFYTWLNEIPVGGDDDPTTKVGNFIAIKVLNHLCDDLAAGAYFIHLNGDRKLQFFKEVATKDQDREAVNMKKRKKTTNADAKTEVSDEEEKKAVVNKKRKKIHETEEKVEFFRYSGKKVNARCSPANLTKVLDALSNDQKEAVKDMGFARLLSLSIHSIPTSLGYFVLKNYDASTDIVNDGEDKIKISSKLIKEVFGIPNGGTELHIVEKPRCNSNNVVEEFRSLFKTKGRIFCKQFSDSLKNIKTSGRMFKLSFLVMAFTVLAETMTSNTVNQRFLDSLTKETNVKKLNWCDYIMLSLRRSKIDWLLDEPKLYPGPLLVLLVLYVYGKEKIRNKKTMMLKNIDYKTLVEYERKLDGILRGEAIDVSSEDENEESDSDNAVSEKKEVVTKVSASKGKQVTQIETCLETEEVRSDMIEKKLTKFGKLAEGICFILKKASTDYPEGLLIEKRNKEWSLMLKNYFEKVEKSRDVDLENQKQQGNANEQQENPSRGIGEVDSAIDKEKGKVCETETSLQSCRYITLSLLAEIDDSVPKQIPNVNSVYDTLGHDLHLSQPKPTTEGSNVEEEKNETVAVQKLELEQKNVDSENITRVDMVEQAHKLAEVHKEGTEKPNEKSGYVDCHFDLHLSLPTPPTEGGCEKTSSVQELGTSIVVVEQKKVNQKEASEETAEVHKEGAKKAIGKENKKDKVVSNEDASLPKKASAKKRKEVDDHGVCYVEDGALCANAGGNLIPELDEDKTKINNEKAIPKKRIESLPESLPEKRNKRKPKRFSPD